MWRVPAVIGPPEAKYSIIDFLQHRASYVLQPVMSTQRYTYLP
jgi:hypothetical protein